MRLLLCFVLLLGSATALAQNPLRLTILDSASRVPIIGASAGVAGTAIGGQTDPAGSVSLSLPAGTRVVVNALGYQPRGVRVAMGVSEMIVLLSPAGEELEEVIVTSMRTDARIEDLPTRVEVLGTEEMNEENGIKPGSITSILGDIAGTQIQPTSPVTGNADLRIQGLPGRYSQILRDGLPLLGGFAGSFGLLQIPPLDLRQIELVKGASSTLYGGGAIAGMVNLVSRQPVLGQPELAVTLNQTTLRESNLNVFGSRRTERLGLSAFAGATAQQAVDVDGDGFADVPRVRNVTVHPRFFFYPKRAGAQLALGYTGTFETRWAGDLRAVHRPRAEATAYRVDNETARHTVDAIYTRPDSTGSLTIKGVASDFYRRAITTTGVDFGAHQLSYYTEISTLRRWGHHTPVFGVNVTGESFRPNSSHTRLRFFYDYITPGAFVQDDWQPGGGPLTVQAGLRLDYHNYYGLFALPRLSLLYRFTPNLTARLGGGLGYRAPVPYTNDLDEREYPMVRSFSGSIKAERSAGFNGDINWNLHLAEDVTLTLNQGIFLTRLADPLLIGPMGAPRDPAPAFSLPLQWRNAAGSILTRGLETYVRLRADETELYLGYLLTDARRQYPAESKHVELIALHKLATVFVQEFNPHFGAGVEASYIGRQWLPDNAKTPGYLIAALMFRYRTGPWTVVLNAENLLDYRQTRRERVVLGDRTDPTFRPLWAPVEGRVVNLSVTWRLPHP